MISEDIQSLSPTAIIELFDLDVTSLGGELHRFHGNTNGLSQPVVWQGNTYTPLPIEATGFEVTTKGALPRPTMRLANVGGLFSSEVVNYDDLVGAKLTRKRTFAKYLDAVNFPGGVNPTADVNQKYGDDIWYVDQKMNENMLMIEWSLASPFDLIGVMLPRRQIIQNSCNWRYRGPECGYVGQGFDVNDQPTSVPADDVCAKRMSSCKCRFTVGGYANVLPFGGFPGVVQYGT